MPRNFIFKKGKVLKDLFLLLLSLSIVSNTFTVTAVNKNNHIVNIVIPQYDYVEGINYNQAKKTYDYYRVVNGSKCGLLDYQGKNILDCKYSDIQINKGDPFIYFCINAGKNGAYNTKNGVLIKPIYSDPLSFNNGYSIITLNGKYGFIDEKGKVVVLPKYNKIQNQDSYDYDTKTYNTPCVYSKDAFIINMKDSSNAEYWGIIKSNGQYIVKPKYTSIRTDGVCVNSNTGDLALLNKQGNVVFSKDATYTGCVKLSSSLYAVKFISNNKWGVIDSKGQIAMNPCYDKVEAFNPNSKNPLYRVAKGSKYGFMDSKGKISIPLQFYEPGSNEYIANYLTGDDLFIADVRINNTKKEALIDKTSGKMIFKPEYDDFAIDWYNYKKCNYIAASKNKVWSIYDKKLRLICKVEPGYSVYNTEYNTVYVTKNKKYYILDLKTGKHIQSSEFEFAPGEGVLNYLTDYGLFEQMYKGGKFGLINNKTSKVIINLGVKEYGWLYIDYFRGIPDIANITQKDILLYTIDNKKKAGAVDINGKVILKNVYDSITHFAFGYAKLVKNKKVGFVDTKFKIIEPKYDDGFSAGMGYLAVKVNGKWGYMNNKGIYLIKPQYQDCGKFSNGLAPVKVKGKWGYINKSNKMVIPAVYEDFTDSQTNRMFPVKKNGKVCVVNNIGTLAATTNTYTDSISVYYNEGDSFSYEPKYRPQGVYKLKKAKKIGLLFIK